MMLVEHRSHSQVLDDTGRGWWAIYTRHQHEKAVADMLSAKGCEVFLPLFQSIRRWKDRTMRLSLPLFPSYVFVREQPDRRLQIVTTPGIHMIVCRGEQFAVIPHGEIETIRKAAEGPLGIEPHPFLHCGERVRVTRGALEGVVGILVRKKSFCRLVLSVDLLAQSAAVEVNASDVAPAEPVVSGPYRISTDSVISVPASLARTRSSSRI